MWGRINFNQIFHKLSTLSYVLFGEAKPEEIESKLDFKTTSNGKGVPTPDTSPEVDARPLKVVEGRDIIDGDTNNSAVVSPENLNNKKCPHLE